MSFAKLNIPNTKNGNIMMDQGCMKPHASLIKIYPGQSSIICAKGRMREVTEAVETGTSHKCGKKKLAGCVDA